MPRYSRTKQEPNTEDAAYEPRNLRGDSEPNKKDLRDDIDISSDYLFNDNTDCHLSEQRNRSSVLNDSYLDGRKTQTWMLEEKVALLDAMKEHGCGDYKSLAEAMGGIRSEIEIKNFLEKNMERIRKTVYESEQFSIHTKTDEEKLENLLKRPANDLWKMIMMHSMFSEDRYPDYSYLVVEFFKQCAEEEEECTSSERPDFKKLYSFLSECCAGNFAGDLRPIDATILMTSIGRLSSFSKEFENEKAFLENFNGTSSFIPASYLKALEEGSPYELEQMHEQMKSLRKASQNGIAIDDTTFNMFYRHMKLRENINPLGINPAMLAEEEQQIAQKFQTKLDEE